MHESSSKSDAILAFLRQRDDEMSALLEELVSIPTENPPGKNYAACVDLLESHVRWAGLTCERFSYVDANDPTDRAESLVCTYGNGKRALCFHGHYDVVPAQSGDQFRPLRKGHFVFGRGSCDMKGGIVAMLYAIVALNEIEAELDGRIVLMLVPDEETGGKRGSVWLAGRNLLGRDAIGMLLAEPTSGVVWNANRGAISLRVRVTGKSAHVGLQHQGENAFERMHRVVEKLQELKCAVEKRSTNFNTGTAQRPNSILMIGGESGGGTNFNVVPAECHFTIDRRINPEEDLATAKAELLGVLQGCRDAGIPLEWEILQEAPSASCSAEEDVGTALSRSVQTVTGETPSFEMCPGLLEIRFYAGNGIPAYAYGPGLLSVAHGPDEYVDLRRVIDTAAIYALTAMEVLKPAREHQS